MRYLSLDVFRGLTIALMIIVNSAGRGAEPFAQLDHTEWFGFTFADLVFPSFLFAMGSSFAFSGASGLSEGAYYGKVIKRTVLLFAIGLFLAWFPFFIFNKMGVFEWKYLENLRIMGVLQRIALCYLLAAVFIRYFGPKTLLVLCLALLLGYWAMLVFGAPNGLAFDKAANFGTQIDNAIIPKSHIFRGDEGFEPEGILGTLPAAVNVLAGYLAAYWLKSTTDTKRLLLNTAALGLVLIAGANLWANYFPISKKLWTSSFVFLCVGLNLLMLAALVFYTELKQRKFGTRFFEIFGQNPLAIYMFSILLLKVLLTIRIAPTKSLYEWLGADIVQPIISGPLGSFVFALLFMWVCWLFGLWLYKKRIIIKL